MFVSTGQDLPRDEESMFKPLHHDHSIESVIFRLHGKGGMMEHERLNLQNGYEAYWKSVLPRSSQAHVMEFAIGPTPLVDGLPKPLAPTTYTECLRNGNAAWWMEIAGPVITIGCTQYSDWERVSSKVFELFNALAKTLSSDHPLAMICSAELTYVNILRWDGTEQEYNPRLAIQESRVPRKALNLKEWHLSEGWLDDPERERILERFQISAELQRDGSRVDSIIRVETTAIWGFGETETRLKLNRAFDKIQEVGGEFTDGRAKYNELHRRVKSLFGTLITKDLADRIELQKSGELK